MKKTICQLLSAILLVAGCSRLVAYFQRGPVQHYNTPKPETVAVASAATPVEVAQPAEEVVAAAPVVTAAPAPAEQLAQANATMGQIEAYVRNDSKLATDKKLNKRMDRVKTMLATATTKASLAPTTTTAKKATLLERMATKRIDKQIKNKLSPERTMAKSLLTIGLIVGVIGLILILVGSGAIGVIALIVGLALILVDLLR